MSIDETDLTAEEEQVADECERIRLLPRRRALRVGTIPAKAAEIAAWNAEAWTDRTSLTVTAGQLDVCTRYAHARLEKEQPRASDVIALLLWMIPVRVARGTSGSFVRISWESNCNWGSGRDREGRAS